MHVRLKKKDIVLQNINNINTKQIKIHGCVMAMHE
jgi:hypothetical protein